MSIESFMVATGVATPEEQALADLHAVAVLQDTADSVQAAVQRLNQLMAEANRLGLRVELDLTSYATTTYIGCVSRRTASVVSAQILKYMG